MTDPIADMFTRIKNAQAVGKQSVFIPHSKFKMEIAKLMQKKGYIKDIVKRGRKIKKSIEIILLYNKNNEPAINDIKMVSKPSRRVYMPFKEMFLFKSGFGSRILSTSKGVLTDQEARQARVGGEVIAEIY